MSDLQALRADGDVSLLSELLDTVPIQRAVGAIERDAARQETRRQLLATAVRLGPRLLPELHRTVAACAERLGVRQGIELFCYPSPQHNAACVRPENGRVFVLFSSELIESFGASELTFVVGHELGHLVFGHHDLPVGALLQGQFRLPPRLALRLFSWSRYAEISADRAGLYCARDLDAVGRAMFKLASGLREGAADVVMAALVEQVQDIAAEGLPRAGDNARADWFATHPFSPIRLEAAVLFAGAVTMTEGGRSREVLEAEVAELMAIMEPGYLKEDSDQARAMRRLLLAGATVVAAASGGVTADEVQAIDSFLGEGTVTPKLGIDALRADLPPRIESVVRSTTPSRRAQVLRDLCVIARADGRVSEAERAVLERVATGLQLPGDLLARAMCGSCELD